jgi:hypothetical protein
MTKANKIYQKLGLTQKFKVLSKIIYLGSLYRVISDGDENLLIREESDGSLQELSMTSSFKINFKKEGTSVQEQNLNILNGLKLELNNNKKYYAEKFMGLYASSFMTKFSLSNCLKDFDSILNLNFNEFDSNLLDINDIKTENTSFKLKKESKESYAVGLGFGVTINEKECFFSVEVC